MVRICAAVLAATVGCADEAPPGSTTSVEPAVPSVYVDNDVVGPLILKGDSAPLAALLPEEHMDPTTWYEVVALSGPRKVIIAEFAPKTSVRLYRGGGTLNLGVFREVSEHLPEAVKRKAAQPTSSLIGVEEVRITTVKFAAETKRIALERKTHVMIDVPGQPESELTSEQLEKLPRATGRRRFANGWELKSIAEAKTDWARLTSLTLHCREQDNVTVDRATLADEGHRLLVHRNRRGWLRFKHFKFTTPDHKRADTVAECRDVQRFSFELAP